MLIFVEYEVHFHQLKVVPMERNWDFEDNIWVFAIILYYVSRHSFLRKDEWNTYAYFEEIWKRVRYFIYFTMGYGGSLSASSVFLSWIWKYIIEIILDYGFSNAILSKTNGRFYSFKVSDNIRLRKTFVRRAIEGVWVWGWGSRRTNIFLNLVESQTSLHNHCNHLSHISSLRHVNPSKL